MIVISGVKLTKNFGVRRILSDIDLAVNARERVGLVGVNGSGKTTLLRILAGCDEPDGGAVVVGRDLRVGYLPQNQDEPWESDTQSSATVYSETLRGREDLILIENRMREIESSMATEEPGPGLDRLVDEYGELMHTFDEQGGHELEAKVRIILTGLGFAQEEFVKSLAMLSGGERTMAALARLLVMEPDILLLDEPTNHLDVKATEWLESYLGKYQGTVIVVSHDRYFLDRVVTRVLELEDCGLTEYLGNYSYYSDEKRLKLLEQQHDYVEQQKEIARLTVSMNRLYAWAHQVLSRGLKIKADNIKRRIERLDKIEKPNLNPKAISVDFKPERRSGEVVITCQGLSVGFGGSEYGESVKRTVLFRDVDLDIRYGQHIALIGPNGCGKSTLLKVILGEMAPDTGTVKLGSGVSAAYYDQRHTELDPEKTALQEIIDYKRLLTQAARGLLARFGLTGDAVFKKIGELSGGEKSRVQLAKLMISGANLLVFDEPTNHLDPRSVEALEAALDAYEGTILFVSHDRYFVNALADKVLELGPDGITEYQGNYDTYLEAKAKRCDVSNQSDQSGQAGQNAGNDASKQAEKLVVKAAKGKKDSQEIESLEEEIGKLEARLAEVEKSLADPGTLGAVQIEELSKEYSEVQGKIAELMSLWETAAD